MDNQVDSTKPQTIEEYAAYSAKLESQVSELKQRVTWFEQQFRLAQQKRFGASSERTPPDQLDLFNEAEAASDAAMEDPTLETITYRRKKVRGAREAKFDHLPVETIHYRLPEEEQVCPCCHGKLHEMSTETRTEIAIIPAQVKVVQHVKHVYGCRPCEREGTRTPIVTAPSPAPAHPGGLASPSILAHVMTQKYVESLPLYRQEQQFLRLGLSLSRQTLANWMMYGAEHWLEPLYAYMHAQMIKQDILHADETTFPVLREPGRKAEDNSYLWLYRTGHTSHPIILYEYQASRSGDHPRKFLQGFSGYLQTDGYSGYHKVENVTLVGCWAHARRKFDEALKTLPASKRTADVAASQGLHFCNQLFAIERDLKGKSAEECYEVRKERSRPVLDAFWTWLHTKEASVLPKSPIGVAVTYCLNQWNKLTAFLKDGRLELDNNRSERSIKPVVIGRKNWLFANTPKGAKASSAIYSIVETAKANGLNPFQYLMHLFEQLPQLPDLKDEKALEKLAPWSPTLPIICRVFTK